MIKVFGASDKVFTTNGDIVLKPLKANVRKEDNGNFYLTLDAGIEYADHLIAGNIIVAPTPTGEQAFRISNPQKTQRKISIRAKHVYYDTENYLIKDSYVVNKNCSDALAWLNAATDTTSPFSTASDITTIQSYRCVRKSLNEALYVVLERWGGHLVRDNFSISILSSIGQDRGVTVRYAKNLKEITYAEDWDSVVTKLLPTGTDGIMLNALDGTVDPYLYAAQSYTLPFTKTVAFDQQINADDYKDASGNIDETAYKTALITDLRTQATEYLAKNCVPKINYTLKANADVIDIGDIVSVNDERLGIDIITSVTAYDYDCIAQRFTQLEFGNFREKKLSELLTNITAGVSSAVAISVNNATASLQQDMQAEKTRVDGQFAQIEARLDRHIVTGWVGSAVTGLSAGSYNKLSLSGSVGVGTKLTLSTGGIKIGADVSYIKISGRIGIDSVASDGERRLRICKNSSVTANTFAAAKRYMLNVVTDCANTLEITPVIVPVSQNDIVYLYYYTPDSGDSVGGVVAGVTTYLTVEVV